MLLNTFLILFFSLLILLHIIYELSKDTIIEGATNYQGYSDDPMILAKKNAGDIENLNKKLQELSTIAQDVQTNTSNISKNTSNISGLKSGVEKCSSS